MSSLADDCPLALAMSAWLDGAVDSHTPTSYARQTGNVHWKDVISSLTMLGARQTRASAWLRAFSQPDVLRSTDSQRPLQGRLILTEDARQTPAPAWLEGDLESHRTPTLRCLHGWEELLILTKPQHSILSMAERAVSCPTAATGLVYLADSQCLCGRETSTAWSVTIFILTHTQPTFSDLIPNA